MHQPPRILIATRRCDALPSLHEVLPKGVDVRVAVEVSDVVARCRSEAPDVLVLDLGMPGHPLEVVRLLQSSGHEDSAQPVLALARTREEAVIALRTGAADAVVDPLDAPELTVRVEALLRTRRARERLREHLDALERLSVTDSLTGLGNRRFFDVRLHEEFHRAERFRDPISLLLIDLDHFKAVNDRLGHLMGDELLRGVAEALGAVVRRIDIACRYGGEEFAVLLPRTPHAGALAAGERIRAAVGAVRIGLAGQATQITASVGVASFPYENVRTEQDLLRAADSALYRAKRAGRDCVRSHAGAFFLGPAPSREDAWM